MLSVWRNVPLRRLQLAALLSGTSGFGYGTALFVWAYRAGGPSGVGLTSAVVLAPAAVLAPFAALIGDRLRRDRTLAVLALSRGLLLAATAVAMATAMPAALVLALAAVASVPTRVYYPTQAALVPSLARNECELLAANALGTGIENAAIVGGPGLAGAMLAFVGPCVVVAVAGSVSLAVALLVLDLGAPAAHKPEARERRASELVRGLVTIGRDRTLGLVVSLYSAQTLLFGALSVVLVKLAIEDLAVGAGGVGLLNGALGAGGVAGGVLAISLTSRLRLGSDLRTATIVWGAPLTLLALVSALPAALALLIVVGAGNVLVDVTSYTLLQRAAHDEVRTRVFGALEGAAVASGALGAFLGGAVVERVGTDATLFGIGAALLGLALAFWRPLGRIDREAPSLALPAPALS